MDQSRDIPDNFERKYADSASVFLEIQGNRANILHQGSSGGQMAVSGARCIETLNPGGNHG